jgi:hypothetical protein
MDVNYRHECYRSVTLRRDRLKRQRMEYNDIFLNTVKIWFQKSRIFFNARVFVKTVVSIGRRVGQGLNKITKSRSWEADGSSANHKLFRFFKTRQLVTMFTKVPHSPCNDRNQYSLRHSILVFLLSTPILQISLLLRLKKQPFSLEISNQITLCTYPQAYYMLCPSFLSWFIRPNIISWGKHLTKFFTVDFDRPFYYFLSQKYK